MKNDNRNMKKIIIHKYITNMKDISKGICLQFHCKTVSINHAVKIVFSAFLH